jgi:hypothetical protein
MVCNESAMTPAIVQLWTVDGSWRAETTICESPSIVKCLSFNDEAREAASRAARASPYVGSHDGLICE